MKRETSLKGSWRVIIVGGGFGGLGAAKALKSDLFDVTLIDRHNYHLYQPLLNQNCFRFIGARSDISATKKPAQ
jgi:NADH dehydrogenase FAD-containing subunit